ncbi:MAG: plasma-membrane proton-efflux P-type ATPase [Ignavibacteria bacterium]|nr:plasma-membrane proton-efflux P-type ATPase [Ignavibacteria bacterium]
MEQKSISTDEAKKSSVPELFKSLSSNEKGLTDTQAEERIKQYGYNEITGKKKNPIIKFLSYFWGPIPWMIEVAAILSAIINHWEDFWIIFALLLLNAIVGFWQEHKADNAIELLKKKLALKTRVLRNGKWMEEPAKVLVPGDVVRVRLGDIIPADIKLISGDYLQVDESALTGESLPVDKHVSAVAYTGSIIRQGEMNALVVSTAMNTFFGHTAELIAETKTKSHFQKAVIKIGNYLIVLAVALVTIIFLVALFRQESIIETLQFALVLTVAAIPVALPAVLSVTMAVGATVLSKKKAIVSKLIAIEEMAGMDVLCSDKTGTITKNELTVSEVEPFEKFLENELLLFAALASRAEDKDPIDDAILTKCKSIESFEKLLSGYKVLSFKPFDPISKRTEATLEGERNVKLKVTKGAPQVILSLIKNKAKLEKKVNELVNSLALKGYRALGVAKTEKSGNWKFVGLIPLFDPPREDSGETIKTAQSMGIDVKMVTGDHTSIAKEIAAKVNLGTNIYPASEILKRSDKETERIVEKADGFSEVFPEHKYRIIEELQDAKHIVGMTGDGVNDAPALKKADAGVAVDGATDAAKSAADIVLTSPGLSVIIDALKESRKIFQRMSSYAIYRIAETIRVLFFITLSIIVFNFYPVTALMIVLIALLNDAPIMAIAYDNVKYSNEPEKWQMRVVLNMATFLGFLGVIFSFTVFYIGENVFHLLHGEVQSFIFLKLAVAGHLTIFLTRTRSYFWTIKPGAVLLWSAIVTKMLATLVAVYGWYISPIGWDLALFVWGFAIVAFVITDFLKVQMYKVFDNTEIIFKRI